MNMLYVVYRYDFEEFFLSGDSLLGCWFFKNEEKALQYYDCYKYKYYGSDDLGFGYGMEKYDLDNPVDNSLFHDTKFSKKEIVYSDDVIFNPITVVRASLEFCPYDEESESRFGIQFDSNPKEDCYSTEFEECFDNSTYIDIFRDFCDGKIKIGIYLIRQIPSNSNLDEINESATELIKDIEKFVNNYIQDNFKFNKESFQNITQLKAIFLNYKINKKLNRKYMDKNFI